MVAVRVRCRHCQQEFRPLVRQSEKVVQLYCPHCRRLDTYTEADFLPESA